MAPRLHDAEEMHYQRRCNAVVRCAMMMLFVFCLSSSSLLPRVSAQAPGQCTTATCRIGIDWGPPSYYGPPGGCGAGGEVGTYVCLSWNATANYTRPMTDCWNNFLTPLAVPDTTRTIDDFDCVEWQLTDTPTTNCSAPCGSQTQHNTSSRGTDIGLRVALTPTLSLSVATFPLPSPANGTWTVKLECYDTTQPGVVPDSYCDRANLTRPNATTTCNQPCGTAALDITGFSVWQDPFQRVSPQPFGVSPSPSIFVSIPLGMPTRLVITKAYALASASWALVSSPSSQLQMLTAKGSGDEEAMVSTSRTVAGSDTLEITMSFMGQSKVFSIGLQWTISNNAYISAMRVLDPAPYILTNGFPLVALLDANTYRIVDFTAPNSYVVSQNFDILVDPDIVHIGGNFSMQSTFTTATSANMTVNPLVPQVYGNAATTPTFSITTKADSGFKLVYNFRVRRLAAVPGGMSIWAGSYATEFTTPNSFNVNNHYNYTVVLPRDRVITDAYLNMPLALEYTQSDSPLMVIRLSVGLANITDRPTLESLPRYTPGTNQNISLPLDFGLRGWVRVWIYIYGDSTCDNAATNMAGRFCYPFEPKIYSVKFKRIGREATMGLNLQPAPLEVITPFQTPCTNLSTAAKPDVWNCSASEFTYSNTGIPRGAGLGLSLCMSAYAGGQRSRLELYRPGDMSSAFNLTLNDEDDANGFPILPQLATGACAAGQVLFKVPGDKFPEGRTKVLFKLESEDRSKHVVYTVWINRLPSSSTGPAAAMSSSAMALSSTAPAAAASSGPAVSSSAAVGSSSAAAPAISSSALAAISSSASAVVSSSAPAMVSSSAPAILSSTAPAIPSSSASAILSSSAGIQSSTGGPAPQSSTGGPVPQSSTGVFVPPVAVVVAVVPQSTDPCTTDLNPCMWNSRCESALTPNTTVVADPNVPVSKTMQCFCWPGFFGDGCSVGILTRALTSTPAGNQTLRVLMVGSSAIQALTAGASQRTIGFTRATLSVTIDAETIDIISNHPSADVRALSEVEALFFTSPSYWDLFPAGYTPASYAPHFALMALSSDDDESGEFGMPASRKLLQSASSSTGAGDVALPIHSGYQILRFFAQFSTGVSATSTVTRSLNATNLLYYSASNCIEVNGPTSWPMRDGSCGPCPEGCNCVGGGRCWSVREGQ